MNDRNEKPHLLADLLPALVVELQRLLTQTREPELAAQAPSLRIFDRCRCGNDVCCGTFYTQPKPKGAYGPGHRNVRLMPNEGTLLILDVVDGQIMCVEVLDRPEIREKLEGVLPEILG